MVVYYESRKIQVYLWKSIDKVLFFRETLSGWFSRNGPVLSEDDMKKIRKEEDRIREKNETNTYFNSIDSQWGTIRKSLPLQHNIKKNGWLVHHCIILSFLKGWYFRNCCTFSIEKTFILCLHRNSFHYLTNNSINDRWLMAVKTQWKYIWRILSWWRKGSCD